MTRLIAGVDEAGRGPLAGPVVAAAVILPKEHGIVGLRDSKKMSARQRDDLYDRIQQAAVGWAIAEATVEEIDEINILHASLLAMKRAVEQLVVPPDEVWVDGNQVPSLSMPVEAFVKGDALFECISAASILAKVARDRFMVSLDVKYPQYGFAKHSGYPTAFHREALMQHGPSPWHRRSYKPVQMAVELHTR